MNQAPIVDASNRSGFEVAYLTDFSDWYRQFAGDDAQATVATGID